MSSKETNPFIQGPILAPLIKFALPILLALFLQAMYGAVDLLIVGRFGDATSISAVSTGSTIMQFVTVLIAGFTMGATVIIGRYIGSRNPELAGRAVSASIWLFAVIALILTVTLFCSPGRSPRPCRLRPKRWIRRYYICASAPLVCSS